TDEPKVPYTIIYKGRNWVLAESEGFAFPTLYADGHNAVILYNKQPDGSFAYTIGKKSEFIPYFPVGPHSKPDTILSFLNGHEKGWGGGSTIGGAPRNSDGSRSRLTPQSIIALVSIALGQGEDLVYCASEVRLCDNLVTGEDTLCSECSPGEEHIGAEDAEIPEMMNDEVLQAARAAAEEAKKEELN
ncbi:MAG: hypothetical protein WC763_07525, partial [Candidatus Paceibacterota bacterium]